MKTVIGDAVKVLRDFEGRLCSQRLITRAEARLVVAAYVVTTLEDHGFFLDTVTLASVLKKYAPGIAFKA